MMKNKLSFLKKIGIKFGSLKFNPYLYRVINSGSQKKNKKKIMSNIIVTVGRSLFNRYQNRIKAGAVYSYLRRKYSSIDNVYKRLNSGYNGEVIICKSERQSDCRYDSVLEGSIDDIKKTIQFFWLTSLNNNFWLTCQELQNIKFCIDQGIELDKIFLVPDNDLLSLLATEMIAKALENEGLEVIYKSEGSTPLRVSDLNIDYKVEEEKLLDICDIACISTSENALELYYQAKANGMKTIRSHIREWKSAWIQ